MATNNPPPIDVLILQALLIAKVCIQGRSYVGAQHGPGKLVSDWPILGPSIQCGVYVCKATALRAELNTSGKSLPRFSARRRMP